MLKKLLHSVREYKLATILSPFLMIGEVAMEVTIPTVMEKLVDNGITPGNMTVVWQQGLLLALCALCSLAFGVGSAVLASYAATGCRPLTFPISTNFPRPVLSPG